MSPTVSVCVATYRRPDQLDRLLNHLAELEPPAGGFEVVVVDDGSPAGDGVAALLAARASGYSVPLQHVTLDANSGRAAARNRAWRLADGEWVAFTDDDCRPDPKWLHHLLEAAEATSAAIVQGRVIPDPESAALLTNPLARSLRVDSLSEFYETANVMYRREVLQAAGGFDEHFPGAGEDTDLGWRVREQGYSAAFAGDALVVHDVVLRTFAQDFRDRQRWGDVVRVVRLHPETRRLCWRPHIFRRSHMTPLAVMAGLPLMVLGRRGRVLFMGGLLYVATRQLKGARSPEEMRQRLAVLAGDFYEVGLVTRSAVRERTVLL